MIEKLFSHCHFLTLSPPIPLRLYTSPYRSNPPFLIFDIRALALRTEHQIARMSKIKNGWLDQYGAKPCEQQQFGTAGIEGVKQMCVYETCYCVTIVLKIRQAFKSAWCYFIELIRPSWSRIVELLFVYSSRQHQRKLAAKYRKQAIELLKLRRKPIYRSYWLVFVLENTPERHGKQVNKLGYW